MARTIQITDEDSGTETTIKVLTDPATGQARIQLLRLESTDGAGLTAPDLVVALRAAGLPLPEPLASSPAGSTPAAPEPEPEPPEPEGEDEPAPEPQPGEPIAKKPMKGRLGEEAERRRAVKEVTKAIKGKLPEPPARRVPAKKAARPPVGATGSAALVRNVQTKTGRAYRLGPPEEELLEAFRRHNGNFSAVGREFNVPRYTVTSWMATIGRRHRVAKPIPHQQDDLFH